MSETITGASVGTFDDVPGYAELVEWFGQWPSFHDAEILSIALNRAGESCLKIQTMTGTVGGDGYYSLQRHIVVSFWLREVLDLSLNEFNHQNVIFGLHLSRTNDGFEIEISTCYGFNGRIACRGLRLTYEPGTPLESS